MELKKINHGEPLWTETLNENFDLIVTDSVDIHSAINTLNDAEKHFKRTQGFGFGLEGTITRIGNLVIAACMGNQRNPQGDDAKYLSETIPVGFRPDHNVSVKSHVYVGSAYQDTRHHRLIIGTDGRIQVFSKNMGAAPLEVSFNVVWITSDTMPNGN